MKTITSLLAVALAATLGAGCSKESASPQTASTCPDEKVLAVYQDQPAIVVRTGQSYCLIADSAAIAQGSYKGDDCLVPSTALPLQYQIVGLHVVFSGRKKSCYGLTTLAGFRDMFGYKLEVDDIRTKN